MTTDDKLAVSQEARDAAAEAQLHRGLGRSEAKAMRDGEMDKHWLVQAFARFEAQARAAGDRAGMEKAAGIAESHDAWPQEGADIASAIRAASTGEMG